MTARKEAQSRCRCAAWPSQFLSSGIAANAAIGLKFFLGRAISVRIDVRDHVYRQQLLARKELVNDVTAMIGIGLFLPVVE